MSTGLTSEKLLEMIEEDKKSIAQKKQEAECQRKLEAEEAKRKKAEERQAITDKLEKHGVIERANEIINQICQERYQKALESPSTSFIIQEKITLKRKKSKIPFLRRKDIYEVTCSEPELALDDLLVQLDEHYREDNPYERLRIVADGTLEMSAYAKDILIYDKDTHKYAKNGVRENSRCTIEAAMSFDRWNEPHVFYEIVVPEDAHEKCRESVQDKKFYLSGLYYEYKDELKKMIEKALEQ